MVPKESTSTVRSSGSQPWLQPLTSPLPSRTRSSHPGSGFSVCVPKGRLSMEVVNANTDRSRSCGPSQARGAATQGNTYPATLHWTYIEIRLHGGYDMRKSTVRMTMRAEVQKFELFYQENLDGNAYSSSAWLFLVARTTIADYWRAHYRRAATHSLEALVEAGWEGPSDADPPQSSVAGRVEDILQSLPERDREVLTCRFLLNLSVRQTAVSMGVTETNVRVMQFRALRR